MQPEYKKVLGDGVKIQVAIWKGNGKNIFCVHGISSNCRVWDNIAKNLIPEHTVYAMDLRGRGHSDKPEKGYSLKIHCEDIRKVIDNLKIKPVIFMGHSLGAYIGIVFSALYPEYVEKLVLFDGGAKLSPIQSMKIFQSIKLSLDRLGKVYSSFDEYLSIMKKAPFLQPWQDYFDEYYRYEVEFLPDGKVIPRTPSYVIKEEAENLKKENANNYYEKIKCPVYILRATEGMLSDDDLLLPEKSLKNMLKKIKNVKVFNIEGTNHYSITFHPNPERDKILKQILNE